MSGIAGIYFLNGRTVEVVDLNRMMGILAHRGADASGLWRKGSVGLTHRMLWTTPESLNEKLPLENKRGDLVLTADARLDNRNELLSLLEVEGKENGQVTDSQLILAAYEKWGEECPKHLLGDFAFVIWDARKQIVFCCRDHFGVKSFYYYQSENLFVFASEIKALFCLSEVPKRLNEIMVGDYLVGNFEDRAITFYQDILRLPAAHFMTVGGNKTSIQSYWSLDSFREIRLKSDNEYAENFLELFTEAVRCRLRSAYPVGSLLSGGLDSSSIACVARDLLRQKGGGDLHTFSAVYDEVPECDERPYIHSVLAQGGFEPHYAHPDRFSPLADLDKIFYHQDEAFLVPNLPSMFWNGLYKAAAKKNVRVLLEGVDGDTTVSHGFAYLTELVRACRWKDIHVELCGISKHAHKSAYNMFREYGISPFVPVLIRSAWRRFQGRNSLSIESLNATICPDFVNRICLKERIKATQASFLEPAKTAREHHCRGLSSGFNQYALEVLTKAAAAFFIEPRYPFYDKRLVEFCLALPPEQKLSKGWTRIILRRAMNNVLPEKVQWRNGKANLRPNFVSGLLTERNRLKKMIDESDRKIYNYTNINMLRNFYHSFVSGKGAPRYVWAVYQAVFLELWFNQANLN